MFLVKLICMITGAIVWIVFIIAAVCFVYYAVGNKLYQLKKRRHADKVAQLRVKKWAGK